jgi:hypothetical protein
VSFNILSLLSNNACCTVTFRTHCNTSSLIVKQVVYGFTLAGYQVTIKFKVKHLSDVHCHCFYVFDDFNLVFLSNHLSPWHKRKRGREILRSQTPLRPPAAPPAAYHRHQTNASCLPLLSPLAHHIRLSCLPPLLVGHRVYRQVKPATIAFSCLLWLPLVHCCCHLLSIAIALSRG